MDKVLVEGMVELQCPICIEETPVEDVSIFSKCKHFACRPCMGRIEKVCHMCRTPFEFRDIIEYEKLAAASSATAAVPSTTSSATAAETSAVASAKTLAIIRELRKVLYPSISAESTELPAPLSFSGASASSQDKVVMFCTFPSYLDLLERFLNKDGIATLRLDGRMNAREVR